MDLMDEEIGDVPSPPPLPSRRSSILTHSLTSALALLAIGIEVSGRNWSVWRGCTLDKDPHNGDLPP